ncbi:MAG: trypsin-like peptidase domain-containing protein [Chloroflexi bacterium]|nr:trypsin-like peptidase domain-containing protein [Chloroflexota bacterium]
MPYFGEQVDAIQVTIPLSGGMSGAPVIDRDGKLVGIVRGQAFPEEVQKGVPQRDFKDIVPVKYLLEIDV